jgi:hypothetical protein
LTTTSAPMYTLVQHSGWVTSGNPQFAHPLTALTGQRVRLTLEADPSYGVTLRWAVLREIRGTVAVFDDYRDCNGLAGQYPAHQPDGVELEAASILEVRAA